jgi:DNA-binding NarL/FixJ family response regulator
MAARAGNHSPEALAAELLSLGLNQKARHARARAALAILTPRERQVAHLAGLGQTNHQIARALMISTETVKSHVRSTLNRLELRSKTELRLLLHELTQEL